MRQATIQEILNLAPLHYDVNPTWGRVWHIVDGVILYAFRAPNPRTPRTQMFIVGIERTK